MSNKGNYLNELRRGTRAQPHTPKPHKGSKSSKNRQAIAESA